MAATLNYVEIPGFRDALKREAEVRRQAWLPMRTEIAGVLVRPITLRDMVMLEEMRNGFFAPWRFDSDDEYVTHCAQLVLWLSDLPRPEATSNGLFNLLVTARRNRMLRHLGQRRKELCDGVRLLLTETFLDAPRGGSAYGTAIASSPAYIADTLAAAGMFTSVDAVMDTPLTQLWQLIRVATRRVYGIPQTNESDRIACEYLGALNARNN